MTGPDPALAGYLDDDAQRIRPVFVASQPDDLAALAARGYPAINAAAWNVGELRAYRNQPVRVLRHDGFAARGACAVLHARGCSVGVLEDEVDVVADDLDAIRTRPMFKELPHVFRDGDDEDDLMPADEDVQLTGPVLNIASAATINPEPIRWLWRFFIALGKMIVLAGMAGTAKTTLALAFAAVVTAAGRWPDGSRCDRGAVLMWSGEDDPGDTLVPRLLAMGADLSRFYFVGRVRDERGLRAFDPASDVPLLAEQAARIPDLKLVIIDPIVSAVAADSHKNGEVRRGQQPLVDMAARHGFALLGITHYTKGTAGRDPLERVTGSLAFGALARVVLGTAKPTDDGALRRLVRAKSNIGPDGGGYEFALQQVEIPDRPGLTGSRVLWANVLNGTARDLLAEVEVDPEAPKPALDGALAFIRAVLSDGPVLAATIKKDAEDAGHAWRTVRRAKDVMGVVAEKEKRPGGRWVWRLPEPEMPGLEIEGGQTAAKGST